MGILKSLVGGILGGDTPKPVAAPAAVRPPEDTSAQDAAEAEAKRKAALLATNAGGAPQGTTVGGGNADVTRKILLGL